MSIFVKATEEGYVLQKPGYVAVAMMLVALVVIAAFVAGKKESSKMTTKQLVFCGMAIALATVTSMLKYSFPFGGSVTLCSMLFICLVGYVYGPVTGIMTGLSYGLLQFLIEPYMLFPTQVILDYLLAFGALGLSGFFWKSKHGLVKGYLLGICGRYLFSVISGCVFFGAYAWEGWSVLPYSLAYNGAYIFTEGIITILVLAIPAAARAFEQVKVNARN